MTSIAQQIERLLASVGDQLFLWRNRRSFRLPAAGALLSSGAASKLATFDWASLLTLGLRNPQRRTPRAAGIAAGLVIALCLLHLGTVRGGASSVAAQDFFIDLDSGRMIAAPLHRAPEDSTGAVVRAYVYACGSCKDADDRHVGYVERISAEARHFAVDGPTTDDEVLQLHHGVSISRSFGGDAVWHPMRSEAARDIVRQARTGCETSAPVRCIP